MPSDNCQKIKLVKILEILQQQTDAEHPISTTDLCEQLCSMHISCDRRTLHRDMKTLNENGYEVMSVFVGHEKAFYVEDRSFSVPELKILMDAVQAASFITEKKTAALIEKIAALGGSHRAGILQHNMVCFNTRKHTNEQIFYTVGDLEEALLDKRKASFLYYDLNEKGERVYRKEGERYVVEPLALVFHEDNYYLVCYSRKYDGLCNYRVDRMTQVQLEGGISREALAMWKQMNMGSYTEQVFKMYNGEARRITLRFADRLLGVVFDKFGEDTFIRRLSDTECETTVTVSISPTFWGWLFQFAGEMTLVGPPDVLALCSAQIQKLKDGMHCS